jgi:hypothetical protein
MPQRVIMRLCRDLGYTIGELQCRITEEELVLWNMLYQIEHEESEQAAKRKR